MTKDKKLNTDYSVSEQMQDELEPIPSKRKGLTKREAVLMDPLAASHRSDAKKRSPNTLQDQAWKRAQENPKPRTGYPWDWLDYEDIKKEDDQQDSKK